MKLIIKIINQNEYLCEISLASFLSLNTSIVKLGWLVFFSINCAFFKVTTAICHIFA